MDPVRDGGFDVRVARYRVVPDVSYAMFSGGGLAWAEAQLKNGLFALAPARRGAVPDLDGLRCDFATLPTARGVVLSPIVVPVGDGPRFASLVHDILALIEAGDAGAPTPWRRPDAAWPRSEIAQAVAAGQTGVAAVDASPPGDVPVGRRLPAQDTDFRTFDDGLRMTVDCAPDTAAAIEAVLSVAQAASICRFGTHRQDAANPTCLLPSQGGEHAHFIDGAFGGSRPRLPS